MLWDAMSKPSGTARNLRLYPRSKNTSRSESMTSLRLFNSKGMWDMFESRGTEQATILIGSLTSALTSLSGVRARTWSAVTESSSSIAPLCMMQQKDDPLQKPS